MIRQSHEFKHQCALIEWARLHEKRYPGLDMLVSSQNGVFKSKAEAGKAKAAGMKEGEHDLNLKVARGGYHGLSIELKYGKGKPTKKQLQYGDRLTQEGWYVCYRWSWPEAADTIKAYLEGKIIKT